jgi:hypothetical protein
MPTATCSMPAQESARSVVPWKPGAAKCCSQELAALVEHGYSMIWSASASTDCPAAEHRTRLLLTHCRLRWISSSVWPTEAITRWQPP